MTDVCFRVAPNGRRLGFAATQRSGRAVSLLVLPKIWNSGVNQVVSEWRAGDALAIGAYEGQDIRVAATAADADWLTSWLLGLEESDGQLLRVQPTKQRREAEAPADGSLAPLLDLLELFDRVKLSIEDAEVPLGAERHDLARLLAYRRFVALVEPLISKLRPRYIEVEDHLTTPRGQIVDSSLVTAVAMRRPEVLCRFDEHTRATDIAIVLLASLRTVARYSGSVATTALFRPLQDRAARLVRLLDGVPPVDRRVAYRRATLIRLSRFERPFGPALELAARVLRDDALLPGSVTGGTADSFRVTVPSEKLWEHVLHEMLLRSRTVSDLAFNADNAQANPSVDVPAPWAHATPTDRYPDFLARVRAMGLTRVWCLDAKYKDVPANTPPSEDAYQLFAYSHLARLAGDAVQECALIYPARTSAATRTLRRQRDRVVPLHLMTAPFPTAEDVRSERAWELFVSLGARDLDSTITRSRVAVSTVA